MERRRGEDRKGGKGERGEDKGDGSYRDYYCKRAILCLSSSKY
jgi:hypothetical protein